MSRKSIHVSWADINSHSHFGCLFLFTNMQPHCLTHTELAGLTDGCPH